MNVFGVACGGDAPAPSQEQCIFPIFSDAWIAAQVWGAARILCAVLAQLPVRGGTGLQVVVEVGAGMGVPTLFLLLLHAPPPRPLTAVLTDVQEALQPLRDTLPTLPLGPSTTPTHILPLHWGNMEDVKGVLDAIDQRPVDLILGSEVVYAWHEEREGDNFRALVETLQGLCTPAHTTILLAMQQRGASKDSPQPPPTESECTPCPVPPPPLEGLHSLWECSTPTTDFSHLFAAASFFDMAQMQGFQTRQVPSSLWRNCPAWLLERASPEDVQALNQENMFMYVMQLHRDSAEGGQR